MAAIYSFGDWVRRRRKALDLTRAELSRQVGCATETVKKIERDERRPSLLLAELLADALTVPTEERERFLKSARGELPIDKLSLAAEPLHSFLEQQHNLPIPLTPLIDREKELAQIAQLLGNPDCQLITLVGPGGVGKSRIALQAAENQHGLYHRRVCLLSLAGIDSADVLPSAIAAALGMMIGEGQTRLQLIRYLQDIRHELLLVLDNFEHLLDGVELLTEILLRAPRVKMLVTSRERLHLQTEWVLPVEGLPFPAVEPYREFEQYPAVRLFIQTARRVRAQFELDEAETPFLARICQLIEGMPLAIELAASWTHLLSCQEIAQEIEQSMDILATSMRDVPERHRSIRSVFDQSWNLLLEEEQIVLQKLSVFRGGFTREAAEQVAGASLMTLAALVGKSLLRLDPQRDNSIYYNLHELIRQYAQERLVESGQDEEERLREDHLHYFVGLAEQADEELHGPDSLHWLNHLERDYDNLRAAFGWATDPRRGSNGEQSQRLVRALASFWHLRGLMEEGCHWAERALAQDSPSEPIRAKALWVSGFLNLTHGNHDLGREQLERAAVLCLRVGASCKLDLAYALNFLGVEASGRGDLDASQAYTEESLVIRQELEDAWGITQSLNNLAAIAQKRGDFASSRSFLEEGLWIARELGERGRIALLLNNLGWLLARQGDVIQARSSLRESLEICRDLKWHWMAAHVFENLAMIEAWQAKTDRLAKAARLWGIAEFLFKTVGAKYRLEESAEEISSARNQLGESSFSKAWEEGGKMTFDQAMAFALED